MVWNTIAHPMMHDSNPGGAGDASTMKNRPLLSVDTAKQSFYDFILNLQVVGYEEVEGKTGDEPPTPIIKPVLVHGNYQDIYNKLMNAQLVIGAQVSLLTSSLNIGHIGQSDDVDSALANITNIVIMNGPNINTGRPATVGGMPIIIMRIESSDAAIDCLNRIWAGDDVANIPFDT